MSNRHVSYRLWNPVTKTRRTIHITAWFVDCRDGFNHFAECDEYADTRVKIHYINRTWECHPFDSVIAKCVDKIKEDFQKIAKRHRREEKRRAKREAKEAARLAKLEARAAKVRNSLNAKQED